MYVEEKKKIQQKESGRKTKEEERDARRKYKELGKVKLGEEERMGEKDK